MKALFTAIIILFFCCNILSQNIEVVSPNGGEIWEINTLKKIEWTSSGITNVKIEYTINSETTWNTIISSVSANSESYYWMVPDINSKLCKVKISNADNASVFDMSDSFFSIKNVFETEPNNHASESTPIEIKDSLAGSIDPAGDIDYYKFFGNTGDTVDIIMKNRNNSELTCYVLLYHESGDQMDNEWFNYNEILRIPFIVPYAGNYFIRIASNYGDYPDKPFKDFANIKDHIQKLNKPDKPGDETGDYSLILKRFAVSAPEFTDLYYYDTYYNSTRADIGIYSNGLDTRVTLEYGITESYGITIELPDLINEVYLSWLTPKIINLGSNSIYHIRVIAENSSGTVVSPDYTFQTPEAPQNWAIKTNEIYTNTFNDVSFVNERIGFAIENYYILKTTDGGDTWDREYMGDYLMKVFCINENTTYILTSYRNIFKTTNGGLDWSTINTGIEQDFNDVYFTDINNGIIVGDEGLIIRTTNGGDDWAVADSSTTEYLYSVCFSDINNGWAAGDNGTILKTTDGGISWNPQNCGTTYSLYDVCFINSDIGFTACRYDDFLLKTTDGGTTWTPQTIEDIYYSHISFMDLNYGLLVNRYSILYTEDGGLNWTAQKVGTTNGLYGVSKAGNQWIVVGDYGTILRSTFGEVGVEENNEIPLAYGLSQNYPNPFNPTTNFEFRIADFRFVSLKIFDLLGREVATLVNEEKPAGVYEITWNAASAGGGLPSGVYFYQIKVLPLYGQTEEFIQTRKMLLIK